MIEKKQGRFLMGLQSKLLVEQHIHGAFGVNLSNAEADEILVLSEKLLEHGIGGYFPTLVTDSVQNIKTQIAQIKIAKSKQTDNMAQIFGIHLEGIFINQATKGIHNPAYFLDATIENYKKVEDPLIKIVTLAPELDKNSELQKYLKSKGIKVQAGHCVGFNLENCDGVSHMFNAMSGISHRGKSTALTALISDNLYTEIIADGVHLSEDIISLALKAKPSDKVVLVSDALPIAQSELAEMEFCDVPIYNQHGKAVSKEGTIAGSTMLLDECIKRLCQKYPFEKIIKMASDNLYTYHNLDIKGSIKWDDEFNIIEVEK